MSDNKENKNSNARLPEELLIELRKEIAPYLNQGKKPPAFGDLLLEAWRAYKKSSPEMASHELPKQEVDSDKSPTVKSALQAQGRSWGIHQKIHEDLQYILDKGPNGMATDIAGNIYWFSVAARVANADAPPGAISDSAARAAQNLEDGVERAREIEQEYLRGPSHPREAPGRKRPAKKKTG